ncbi:MAG: hypothetical protein QOD77_1861 [Thermoplasmata archaeon]|jgi:PKD repeat protein|nr:hypothetical protein [Thermoplasmata archaeon]
MLYLQDRVVTPRMTSSAAWAAFGVLAALAATGIVLLATPAEAAVILEPAGPLEQIHISRSKTLDCQVMYIGTVYSFPGSEADGEFWGVGSGSCGTFLHVVGDQTYGPPVEGYGPPYMAGGIPPTPYTPVSQVGPTGTGTVADPWTIDTVARAVGPGTLVELHQVDEYVKGDEYYTTTVTVSNLGAAAVDLILYRAGDCYLTTTSADPDSGYGYLDVANHTVACTETPGGATGRIIEWVPLTPGAHAEHNEWDDIWMRPMYGDEMADTCLCATFLDNGAGLSWAFSLGVGQDKTYANNNVFSPTGVPPPPDPDVPPVARATAAPGERTCFSAPFFFSGTASTDSDGTIVSYLWDFGDGSPVGAGATTSHDYPAAGTYTVRLTVTDDDKLAHTVTFTITSLGDTDCPFTLRVFDSTVREGALLRFCIQAEDLDGGAFTYAATYPGGLPAGLEFDVAGCLDWTPAQGQAGKYDCLTFTAMQGGGPTGAPFQTATDCATITVVAVPPVQATDDTDMDGVADEADNCPSHVNRDQADSDRDGPGDACDPVAPQARDPSVPTRNLAGPGDQDGDRVADRLDNCPERPNASQDDRDRDGLGDGCDPDEDGDGIIVGGPFTDNCPLAANRDQADADRDGVGDACDLAGVTAAFVPARGNEPALHSARAGPSVWPWVAAAALGALAAAALVAVVRRRA